ncbi:hypothetical protein HOE39_02480 [Candidatus Woesearchaeota archaeon]|jgi:hypothetical protein|nr:hypothetical protein [Candidatus Woesearchaeota archaeon]
MKSRKGMSLPIETVIIMIIAIVVLALVLLFVTGKWTDLTGTLGGLETGISDGATESVEQIFE